MVLVCSISATAQKVVEDETHIKFSDLKADLETVIYAETAGSREVHLEIIDTNGVVKAAASTSVSLRPGRRSYKFTLPVDQFVKTESRLLPWYRLGYSIGDTSGVISLSEIMQDDFELRAYTSKKPMSGEKFTIRVRTLHPQTQRPISGVDLNASIQIDLDEQTDKKLTLTGKAVTNGDGLAFISISVPAGIVIDEVGDLKIVGKKGGVQRTIDADLDQDNYDLPKPSVFLTSDKPIYQPGQAFMVRALYFDETNVPLPDKELEFSIEDEDDTVLFKTTVKTSVFGIASVAWTIPENAKLGNYRVNVEAEDDLDLDSMSFKVSRYDLPNFAVSAKPDKSYYLPSDTLARIEISADYLFGKPVQNGKVRVVEESERHWNWKEQKYDVVEKGAVEGEADRGGKYTASFDLAVDHKDLQDSEWRRFEDLHFAAYVTDLSTNRTEQKRFDIRITKEPVHIYFIRSYYQNSRLPLINYLSTFYADGTPAICDVEVRSGPDLLSKLKTNSYGAGKFIVSIPKSQAGYERKPLRVTARDKRGLSGTLDDDVALDNEDDALQFTTSKTIFKAGEPVDITLRSTSRKGIIYIDVIKNWSVIDTHVVRVVGGEATLSIPYRPEFKGDLTVVAYGDMKDDDWDNRMRFSRGIVYPEQQNLIVNAKFASDTFRPSEDAKVRFSVLDGRHSPAESALGIVVFDKAVEQRAKTDADFGGYYSGFYRLLGYGQGFGSITLKDINDLDMTREVSPAMDLAAEVMLAGYSYRPRVYYDDDFDSDAKSAYAEYFRSVIWKVDDALQKQTSTDQAFPTDVVSLSKVLDAHDIKLETLKDPWDSPLKIWFTIEGPTAVITLTSAGPDKRLGTDDDIEVFRKGGSFFRPYGIMLDRALSEYTGDTGHFIRDTETFLKKMENTGLDIRSLRDPWGRPYYIDLSVAGRSFVYQVNSAGPNGKRESASWSDDIKVWTSYVNYFHEYENRINDILAREVNGNKKPFPVDEQEFTAMLKRNGLNLTDVKDGYDRPVYLTSYYQDRYVDETTYVNGKQVIKPVSVRLHIFSLRSRGQSPNLDNDDEELASFSSVITRNYVVRPNGSVEISMVAYTGAKGAIKGTITDANGAVVPNVPVTAVSETNEAVKFSTTSNENGEFLLGNIPPGKYRVTAEAYAGFKASTVGAVEVRAQTLTQLKIELTVGAASATVDVCAGNESIDVTSSKVETTISTTVKPTKIVFPPGTENSTPRLREYFPETLVWQPELVTDKKGKAELTFKMADNITTWKMYAIASTKKGKVGVVEKEVTAFQPFFVDLDPPKFLTEGDEIWLPSQVRNYTDKRQEVDVTMTKANWFSALGSDKQHIDVEPGSSQNATFGFKAVEKIKDGKQRLTAIASSDSDAIEKPVTVRPNGEEIVRTDSKVFSENAVFNVDFPANALNGTQKADLKIYPNLFSHVSDSVEGLLERPYGCGEQTISSTYPNLMILKFVKEDSPIRKKAMGYLQKGYERLLGYQTGSGGFSYWGAKDTPDIALTAYAVRFLSDADSEIDVDRTVIEKAQNWLIQQQKADGSWVKSSRWYTDDERQTKLTTSYVARALVLSKISGRAAVDKAIAFLEQSNAAIDEPYALALLGLVLLETGNVDKADKIAKQLEKMAINEEGAAYWNLETNTPFYGWGTPGRIETTALVLQLLIRDSRAAGGNADATRKDLINKATLFLLKNKDRYGVWYSTQTTINVLDAFLAALSDNKTNENQAVQITINGDVIENLVLTPDKIDPLTIDLTGKLTSLNNRVEVRGAETASLMAQVVATHYIDWRDSESAKRTENQSRALRLDYKCGKSAAAIMEDINCSVEAERIGFRGYGMLLAEIGTPPGADVSRESLENAISSDWSISRYDILPDRIVVYMWSRAGGTKFNFKFKLRYGINAQTPASIVYDYYNPEAKAIQTPLRFVAN
jgi:hypothetical protein